MKKQCAKHGLTEFRNEKQNKDGYLRWRCVKCSYERQMKYQKNVKLKLVAECGGKCSICGYSKCMNAMEFHHLDRSKKEFQISRGFVSFEKLLKEARKCLLVCCRCHREIEAGIYGVCGVMVSTKHCGCLRDGS